MLHGICGRCGVSMTSLWMRDNVIDNLCARAMVPLGPRHEGRSITKASLKEVVSVGSFKAI